MHLNSAECDRFEPEVNNLGRERGLRRPMASKGVWSNRAGVWIRGPELGRTAPAMLDRRRKLPHTDLAAEPNGGGSDPLEVAKGGRPTSTAKSPLETSSSTSSARG